MYVTYYGSTYYGYTCSGSTMVMYVTASSSSISQLARKRLCGLKVPRSTSPCNTRSRPRQERCTSAVRERG